MNKTGAKILNMIDNSANFQIFERNDTLFQKSLCHANHQIDKRLYLVIKQQILEKGFVYANLFPIAFQNMFKYYNSGYVIDFNCLSLKYFNMIGVNGTHL